MVDRILKVEERASAIWGEARSLLDVFGISVTLPWNMRVVAAMLTGGPVEPLPNLANPAGERLAGLLEGTLDRASIFFEAYDPVVRQRFSIAHELGHFFLHMPEATSAAAYGRCTQRRVDPADAPEDQATLDDTPDEETEADAFAATLLMPTTELEADLALFGLSIPFLAARYMVSEAAMRRRLANLGQAL